MEDLTKLICETRSGDLEAYGEIVRRFQDMAFGYAYSVVGDFHLAQDVAQEGFIRAYQKLSDLREPAAFGGWFRQIVFSVCREVLRGRKFKTVPLERIDVADLRSENLEMQEDVVNAIKALPEHQRVVTTLFYINGYSHNEIADFLEVPVGTVKKRLHDSRRKLKERMMGMVEETLKSNAPDERFSKAVIEELLGRPRPLEIEGHPVREVFNLIRNALSEYECIDGAEMIDRSKLFMQEVPGHDVYVLDENHFLRGDTTTSMMTLIIGRKVPVRLLMAGRVFRPDLEDKGRQKVFHQLEVVCIDRKAGFEEMKATVEKAFFAVLGKVDVRWNAHKYCYPWFEDQGYEMSVKFRDQWFVEIGGSAIMKADALRKAGYDADVVGGFSFGLGLERLAMVKYGIDDIRKLWLPPYIKEKTGSSGRAG